MTEDEGQPGWKRAFAILWISQMVAMVGFAAVLPFMPLYIQSLGIPDPGEAAVWAGMVASIAALTQAFMAPVWGALADRYGRKPMVTRSILSGGVIVTAMAFVGDVRQLLGLRAVQGVFAGTLSAARVLVASIVPSNKLGQSLGLMATGAFIGSSTGPILGGFVADQFGFRASFFVTGALLMVSGASVILFVREDFIRPTVAQARGLRSNLAVLIEFPQVRAVVVSIFIVQVGQMAISPVLPLFVQELTGTAESAATVAGMVLGAAAVTSAGAASIGGRLGDQIGHQRVLAVAAVAAGVLYMPQALVTDPWQLLALRALLGVFVGGLMPVSMAIVALLTPVESRGWVFGLTATAMALGNAVGPIMGATVASAMGLRASFVFTSVVLTLAGIWVALAVQSPRARASEQSASVSDTGNGSTPTDR